MTNPDAKYGRNDVTVHEIESFKDCIMNKLKFARSIDFKKAVQVCLTFGKKTGYDIDKNESKFYAKLFDEIQALENYGFVTINRQEGDDGKERIQLITLADKGTKWFESNDLNPA